MDVGAAEFHQFGPNTFFFQLAEHVAEQNGSVPASSGAAVECNNSHMRSTDKGK
jgi:hypothetical protein